MHGHHAFRPDPVPQDRLSFLINPDGASLAKRSSAPSSTCSANNNSPACEKPTSSSMTTTLPVVLGVVYVNHLSNQWR
jgi:hypothetical protein